VSTSNASVGPTDEHCPECLAHIPDADWEFCPYCGSDLPGDGSTWAHEPDDDGEREPEQLDDGHE